jgi:hypothetical protein
MARNRKSQSAELRFGPALKALLICFFIGGAGIGYVYQKNLLNKLGEEKKNRERELNQLQVNNAARERQRWQLGSQRMLERRVEELGLGLQPPSPSQIVVVVDEPLEAVPPTLEPARSKEGSALAKGIEPSGDTR